jgi:hypothetical protein
MPEKTCSMGSADTKNTCVRNSADGRDFVRAQHWQDPLATHSRLATKLILTNFLGPSRNSFFIVIDQAGPLGRHSPSQKKSRPNGPCRPALKKIWDNGLAGSTQLSWYLTVGSNNVVIASAVLPPACHHRHGMCL